MPQETKVKTLAKAIKLLECFSIEEPELGVTELSEKLDLYKSNVHNILSTYQEYGYIEKNPKTNKYHLGYKILELSKVVNSHLGISSIVNPVIKELAEELNEVVYFAIPKGPKVLYIEGAYPKNVYSIRVMLGETAEMYCTALGKAMLANMPIADALPCIHAQSFTPFTDNTITTPNRLIQELELTRTRGYSMDNMEHEYGIKCVGVPIFNRNNQLIGAISVSGPSLRFDENAVKQFSDKLTSCALTVSLRL